MSASQVVQRLASPVLFLLILAGAARPQARPGDAMIDAYLAREAARISERVLDGATTLADWQARRPRLKQEYLDMLGLWPLPARTPLHATVTGTFEREDFVVEKLHYQSRPGLYVTANLYRPKKVTGRLPAVLYVCGHSGRGRDGNKTAFQDHGMWCAKHGYVCLILDTLQLGEIPGVHHGTYSRGRWWWQARGYTPAGVECWNGIRGIDYLLSRPDVDRERLAVTGISGGGAATFWISAADQRVRCAVPVSGMSDLESYVSHKIINGHCDCMFLINTYQWEWTTIAALVAPRPLLFCNSDHDRIFPMDGNRRIIARLRKLYQLYGKPELVDDYISHGDHEDRPDLRVAAFQWINKHLKQDTGPVGPVSFPPIPGKELRVFPEDKDVPQDALNGKIDETFVPRATAALPQPMEFGAWKQSTLQRLRRESFRAFPERIPAAKVVRQRERKAIAAILFTTEPGIEVVLGYIPGLSYIPGPIGERGVTTLLVASPDTMSPKTARETFGPWLRDGEANLFLPRGVGRSWTQKSPPNYVERAHALLGRTVDEGRVWDIAAMARFFGQERKRRVRVVGRGQAGILAAYAALFEPSITEVVVVDPPGSHRDGPIFLNVLRVLDIPEALGLLAPRPLTLVNARDKAFDRTAAIYKAAGAAEKFQRK